MDRVERLKAEIDGLPDEMRDVVNAIYWERLSLNETARRFHKDKRTVKALLHAAYAVLRERLGGDF